MRGRGGGPRACVLLDTTQALRSDGLEPRAVTCSKARGAETSCNTCRSEPLKPHTHARRTPKRGHDPCLVFPASGSPFTPTAPDVVGSPRHLTPPTAPVQADAETRLDRFLFTFGIAYHKALNMDAVCKVISSDLQQPEHVASRHTTRRYAAPWPHHTTAHHTTPRHSAAHHIRPEHTTPHHSTIHHTTPRHTTPHSPHPPKPHHHPRPHAGRVETPEYG